MHSSFLSDFMSLSKITKTYLFEFFLKFSIKGLLHRSQVQTIDAALRHANVLGLPFVGISFDCVSILIILHITHAFSCTLAILEMKRLQLPIKHAEIAPTIYRYYIQGIIIRCIRPEFELLGNKLRIPSFVKHWIYVVLHNCILLCTGLNRFLFI